MEFPRTLAVLAAFALTAPAALAQLTVGPAGSGAQYEQIADAVAAAAPNATIEVAPGTYEAFSVDAPVTILGRPVVLPSLIGFFPGDVVVQGASGFGGAAIVVHDLPADTEVHLVGLTCSRGPEHLDGLLVVEDCDGLVRLTNVVVEAFAPRGPLLRVDGSHVVADGCHFGFWFLPFGGGVGVGGGPAPTVPIDGYNAGAYVVDSNLVAVNSAFRGARFEFGSCASAPAGLFAVGSDVALHRCWCRGGEAQGGQFSDSCAGTPGPGVEMVGGTLRLTGGPQSTDPHSPANLIEPGPRHWFLDAVQGPSGSSVRLRSGADLSRSPDVLFGGQIEVVGPGISITVDAARYPVLFVDDPVVRPGGSTRLAGRGAAQAFHAVYLSPVPGRAPSIPGVEGVVELAPSTTIPLTVFSTGNNGVFELAATLPVDPILAGLELYFQSAEISGSGIRLSNLATLVVTP